MDRPLLAAALAYAAAAGNGARVAVREVVPGEPFGFRAPGRIGTQLALAWGAGISAPWPMPAAVLLLASRNRPGAVPGVACLAIGAATLAGQFAEPVSWGRRPSSPAVDRAIALNLVCSLGLVLAGRRRALRGR